MAEPAAPAAPQVLVQLVFTLSTDRQIRIDGIPQDEILCYGLIAKATKRIEEYFAEQAKQAAGGLTIPDGSTVQRFTNGGNGA